MSNLDTRKKGVVSDREKKPPYSLDWMLGEYAPGLDGMVDIYVYWLCQELNPGYSVVQSVT
jgi:hypothetical protein